MKEITLGNVEAQFADIVWKNEPISTKRLIELCEQQLEWNRSTTYTVLRRLIKKGIFEVNSGMVTSMIEKEEFQFRQCENYINANNFSSLPMFIAAFAERNKISKTEADEIRKLLDNIQEEQ